MSSNPRSLRTKITFLFFAVTIAIITSMCAIFLSWARRHIYSSAVNTEHWLLAQMNLNIEAMQSNLLDLSSLLALNPQTYMTASGMRDIISTQPELSMVALYSQGEENGVWYYSDSSNGLIPYSAFRQTDYYQAVSAARGKPVWRRLKQEDDDIITVDSSSDRIIMARSVRNLYDGFRESGVLLMGIHDRWIGELCNVRSLEPHQCILLVDAEGKLLYESCDFDMKFASEIIKDPNARKENYWEATINGEAYTLFDYSDNRFGWTLYLIAKRDELFGKISVAMYTAIILGSALLLGAAFAIIYFISRAITRPLETLHASMASLAGGDWQQHVPVIGRDEIGALSLRYNEMVKELRRLVDENYVLALHEREAELRALQAQINPHFLYNTLAIFHAMSVSAGQQKLAEMTIALSKLFRISLGNPDKWITVAEEKEFLCDYLTIQKVLYFGRIVVICEFDPEMLPYQIPKLLLQPFVENAITHGIDRLPNGGLLEIYGYLEEDMLVFTVEDNGPGMDAETLGNIKKAPSDEKIQHGFAIWNVLERLRLHYGDASSLEFESEKGEGVCVTIKVPARKHDSGTRA